MKFIFITGLYRSGTTLLQKIINNHDSCTVINHGTITFFTILKQILYEQKRLQFCKEPFCFRFRESKIDLNKIRFSGIHIEKLIDGFTSDIENDLKLGGEKTRPDIKWVQFLEDILKPGTASDVLKAICLSTNHAINKPNVTVVGLKELNLEEFAQPIIDGLGQENVRFIKIIRDPRAITASRNYGNMLKTKAGGKQHPLWFISKVWRTSIHYTWHNNANYPDSATSIFYEELVKEPELTIRKIFKFIDIPFTKDLLNLSSIKNENGKIWVPNSSYQNRKSEFSTSSVKRWQTILSKDEQHLIEALCYAEMVSCGYEMISNSDQRLATINTFQENLNSIKKWTIKQNLYLNAENKKTEIKRLRTLEENLKC